MNYPFPVYDAHNHLHDTRLSSQLDGIIAALRAIPVRKSVVNGTSEADWPQVADLAAKYSWVMPSYGLHPWHVNDRTRSWLGTLESILTNNPAAAIGEIGLDRWIEDHDFAAQVTVFISQLALGARLNRPVSIHCLKASAHLLDILKSATLPSTGFLLHSYGGPAEMIKRFLDLGAYFSLSGYFAHDRKSRQRETFSTIPLDRLLLETDAPDMTPPPTHLLHFLSDSHGSELNHPANIPASYELAAEIYSIDMDVLATRIEANFQRFFASVLTPETAGTNR